MVFPTVLGAEGNLVLVFRGNTENAETRSLDFGGTLVKIDVSTLPSLIFLYLPALSLLHTRRSTTLVNALKMPIYRAAADFIPITNQGHEDALFRHFPGFFFSERVCQLF